MVPARETTVRSGLLPASRGGLATAIFARRCQLAAAAQTFRRLGATPWAARADRELRATGITIATAGTGLASLTPQQRQIALLAAAGHTNKEIPARLFLSPQTVSTHLYQVFPYSASPPAPPSATHSPTRLPNEPSRRLLTDSRRSANASIAPASVRSETREISSERTVVSRAGTTILQSRGSRTGRRG